MRAKKGLEAGREAEGESRTGARAAEAASLLDHGLSRLHRRLFGSRPFLPLLAAALLYALVVLAWGERLEISSNYLVILPVLTAALAYGLPGGLAAGLLGLPANLLLFAALGHPEYSPASKPIAELSGIVVGGAFGYLADYFRALEAEIGRRRAAEASLREALAARNLLLHEVHHRVKNNLNVIKSLVQLQKSRSTDRAFLEAAEELVGRIFAIALVHDQLFGEDSSPSVEPEGYLRALVGHIAAAEGRAEIGLSLSADSAGRRLSPDAATNLGLILHEVLTNAFRHAFAPPESRAEPRIELRFEYGEGAFRLLAEDNGRGFSPGSDCPEGLGLKLVSTLSRQLRGEARFSAPEGGGCRFELSFPE